MRTSVLSLNFSILQGEYIHVFPVQLKFNLKILLLQIRKPNVSVCVWWECEKKMALPLEGVILTLTCYVRLRLLSPNARDGQGFLEIVQSTHAANACHCRLYTFCSGVEYAQRSL